MTWVHWSDEELDLVEQASDVYSVITVLVTTRAMAQIQGEVPVDQTVQRFTLDSLSGPFSKEIADIKAEQARAFLPERSAIRVYVWPQWMACGFAARIKKGTA